jgi:hypothetical protein
MPCRNSRPAAMRRSRLQAYSAAKVLCERLGDPRQLYDGDHDDDAQQDSE